MWSKSLPTNVNQTQILTFHVVFLPMLAQVEGHCPNLGGKLVGKIEFPN
jgi:hypothetical protein